MEKKAMDKLDYLSVIDTESARLIDAVAGRLADPVSHCGEWTMRGLAAHVGFVWTVAVTNVAAGIDSPTRPGDDAQAPDDDAEITAWLQARRAKLLDTLGDADPDDTAWGFAGDLTAGFWQRRMAHETTIHRWDAEFAAGGDVASIDGEIARDGIDEYTTVGLRFSSAKPERDYPSESLHLHRTDGEGEWMFVGDGSGGVVVTAEHGKGDAAVRGSAENLLLWIWGRPVVGLELFGDADVARRWQAVAP